MNVPISAMQIESTLTAAGYWHIYNDTKFMVQVASGLTEMALEDGATELGVDYELFCVDYRGPYLVDAYLGFIAMMRQWPFPWPATDMSALNGLTLAQFFLIWAWKENDAAKYCLGAEAVSGGWKPQDALECGVIAAVSAAKSLVHAEFLLASGGSTIGFLGRHTTTWCTSQQASQTNTGNIYDPPGDYFDRRHGLGTNADRRSKHWRTSRTHRQFPRVRRTSRAGRGK